MTKKIFIIHGWSYNLDKWQKLLPLLEQKGIEPIMLKVPGLSAKSDKVWDIEGYVDWLDNELKNQDDPIVAGHSNGGRIALSYIQKHPDKISKLILIDSAGVANKSGLRKAKLGTLKTLSKVGKPLSKIPGVQKTFYKLIGARDYQQAPPNMKQTMANMLAADKKLNIQKIDLPVTIIWGSDDTITPLSDGQKMSKLLPDSKLNIVQGARHAPMDTHSDRVADIIAKAVS